MASLLSRTETAYRRLLEGLLQGSWRPGDTLSAYALAEELQLSRSPVTEALKRLESEGLVEILPQVGCRVVRPSAAMVEELFLLRGAIEALTARRAAHYRTDRELRDLKLLLVRLDAAIEGRDWTRSAMFHDEFHTAINRASRMPRVEQVATVIWPQLRFCLAQLPCSLDEMLTSAPHHPLFEAIAAQDGDAAQAAAEQHAAQVMKQVLSKMDAAEAVAP